MGVVSMYSAYKDIGYVEKIDGHLQQVQDERDSVLVRKMAENHVPEFPMDWTTFLHVTPTLEHLSKDDPQLCMVFVVNRKCYLLSNGKFSPFRSKVKALHDTLLIKELYIS
jgi:hypothetical protein